MMESLEMSESSRELEEPPPGNNSLGGADLEEGSSLGAPSPSKPSPYKQAFTKIERFLSTPTRKIGNNSVEPVLVLQENDPINKSNNIPMDYPVLKSSPFHFKRRDLLLKDPSTPANSQQPLKHLQTPSGTSVGGDFTSATGDEDDDQQRLTSGGRSSTFSPPRLPCGVTNFHLSLFFGMTGFILFWLVLLLRIYLPPDYFGGHPTTESLHRSELNGSILIDHNESFLLLLTTTSTTMTTTLTTTASTKTRHALATTPSPPPFHFNSSSNDSSDNATMTTTPNMLPRQLSSTTRTTEAPTASRQPSVIPRSVTESPSNVTLQQ